MLRNVPFLTCDGWFLTQHDYKRIARGQKMKKIGTKKVAKATRKTAAKRRTAVKCPKCGHRHLDMGEIKVGKVFTGHGMGYRSDKHYPYADHVNQNRAQVCLKCGYTEIYFDVEDLKRKLKQR